MASELLPRPQGSLVGADGAPLSEWYEFWRTLAEALDTATSDAERITLLEAAVAALQAAGTTTGEIVGLLSIRALGSLADGQVVLQLEGDTLNPGERYYYGSDDTGAKGWYQRLLATLADVDLTDLADGDVLRWDATAELWVVEQAVESVVATAGETTVDATDPQNPIVGLANVADGGGGLFVKVAFDGKGRRTGTTLVAAADLTTLLDPVYIRLTEKGAALGVVPLDATTKIDPAYLPALAITDTFVVASQAAMLALTAETGDVAVRTDLSQSFILTAMPATVLANWQVLLSPTSPVTSVFGRIGVVSAIAADYAAFYGQLATINTWALAQTFTVAPVFTDQAGTRSALSLGTAALKNTGTSGDAVPLLDQAVTWSGLFTFGSNPRYSATGFLFIADTADGADTKSAAWCGGGSTAVGRGGAVIAYGNEHASFPGRIRLVAGNASNIISHVGSPQPETTNLYTLGTPSLLYAAVYMTTQAPLTSDNTGATTEYVDLAVAAGGGGGGSGLTHPQVMARVAFGF